MTSLYKRVVYEHLYGEKYPEHGKIEKRYCMYTEAGWQELTELSKINELLEQQEGKRHHARIQINHKRYSLGSYDTKEEAQQVKRQAFKDYIKHNKLPL